MSATDSGPMEDEDGRIRYNAVDPTSTITLRRSFQGAYGSRWQDVRGRNRDWVQDLQRPYNPRLQSQYRDFFTTVAHTRVLDPLSSQQVRRGNHWTARYVRQAYQKGLRLARQDMSAFGVSAAQKDGATQFTAQMHQDRLRREYESIYFTTEEHVLFARKQVGDALRHALENEKSVSWLADETNARLRSKVRNRYKASANTSIVRTVNEALLTAFESAGVASVGVAVEADASTTTNYVGEARVNAVGELEFVTAGDDRVCTVCQGLAGTRVAIEDVRGSPEFQPPVHPNCRCRLVPVSMEVGGEEVAVPESFEGGLRSDS